MQDPLPLIEIKGLSYQFGDRVALDNVSIAIRQGEYVSIVGPNGSGKTTLLRCINRVLRSGNGNISIAGKPIKQYSQKDLARQIAYVPQAEGRLAPFTALQFVLMGRYPHLSPFAAMTNVDRELARNAMWLTGTEEFANRYLASLSGGERQKVFLAAALTQETSILLLDELSTFLDPRHQVQINRVLRRINQENRGTILCATHDLNDALAHSTRIVALRNGSVLFDGPAHQLASKEILRQVYKHDFLITKHPTRNYPMVFPNDDSVSDD